MKKNAVNLIFVLCALLFLLASLGKAMLRPKEMNYYENRYAERIPPFSLSAWLDGSFQDGTEAGLDDQVPGAHKLKKLYHSTFSLYQKLLALPLAERLPGRYVNLGEMRRFGQHLCYYAADRSVDQAQFDRKIENYNAVFAAEPDTEFYLYYVEKDTDFDFEAGEKPAQVYEYLRDHLDLPPENTGCFRVSGYEDYSSRYYRTDHHWNHVGSYQGYLEMLSLLAPEETPLVPLEERYVGTFSGSKASGRELVTFSEPFYAYRFDFPEMTVEQDGAPSADYGQQDAFFAGEAWGLNYGEFYGGDAALAVLRTAGNEDRENLLLIGDSFDNAVLKLLASHFNTTYAVDLRYYSTCFEEDFRLGEFLEAHDIGKVLISGNRSFYNLDDFLLED